MAKKTVTPYVPNPIEKVAALGDVAYEIEQILDLCSSWPQQAGLQMNAWLEATLIHARQLLDFFEHSKRSTAKGSENDDVLATDYNFGIQDVPIDPLFRERLNKDLAHLSYSRQQRAGTAKSWDLAKLRPLLERSRDFAAHVLTNWQALLPSAEAQRWSTLASMLATI